MVAPRDGHLAGFCSYGLFRLGRAIASRWRTPATRIVLIGGVGVARQWLSKLIERATAQGMHCMIGGIEAQYLASVHLHALLGLRTQAALPAPGRLDIRALAGSGADGAASLAIDERLTISA